MKTPRVAMLILVLGVTLAGLVLSGVLPGRVRQTLPPAPSDQWRAYSDERFGFSFNYPPDWHLNVVPADVTGGGVQISTYDLHQPPFKGTVPEDYFKVEIMVVGGDPRAPGQALEDWRHARFDYDPSKPRQEKQVVVTGVTGLEETVEEFPGWVTTTIYLPYNHPDYGDTVLFISGAPMRNPALEGIFRQIVSTFRWDHSV